MSPETPGNLVLLDLTYDQKDVLLMAVESVEPPQTGAVSGWLRVRFDEAPSTGFYPVGDGVAFVRQPDGYDHEVPDGSSEVSTIPGTRRYIFTNVAQGDGLQLILILPPNYTLNQFSPTPSSAKEFHGRIAVYFRPEQKFGETSTVTFGLQKFRGSIREEAKRLRGEFQQLGISKNSGAFVDKEDPDFNERMQKESIRLSPASPSRLPTLGFLDSIIVLFVSAALVIFLLWATSRTIGINAFEILPSWLERSYNAIWTAVATGATGIGLAIIKGLNRKPESARSNYLLYILLTTILMLTLIFLLPHLFSKHDGDDLSGAERQVSKLEDNVNGPIRAAWENMAYSPADRAKILDTAPKAGESLLLIGDTNLRPVWKIVKYESAEEAFGMSASAEPAGTDQEKSAKKEFADKCLKSGRNVLAIVDEARGKYGSDENSTKAVDFVLKGQEEARTKYFMAICYCRLADIQNNNVNLQAEAQKLLNEIPQSFIDNWPVSKNPEFSHCASR
ncbi:MAG TPA: hypothetical protein VI685_13075 [Candidatus Angelobacter sp.]